MVATYFLGMFAGFTFSPYPFFLRFPFFLFPEHFISNMPPHPFTSILMVFQTVASGGSFPFWVQR